MLWPLITPFVWFLFFPAVFFSARVGGLVPGILATLESALIVIFFFIQPQLSFQVANPLNLLSVAVFGLMGYLFSRIQDQLARANQETRAALEETRAADELKTRFFANVSHELRTPLTIVLGTIQRLRASPATPGPAREELEAAERNARHVFRHVSDLLDLAKLEAAETSLAYERCDLAPLLRTIVSYFEAEARARGLSLELDLPPSLVAELDPEKFRRIVTNLLSNALKFTGSGGRVRLGLEAREGWAYLQVEDNGRGIPEDMREAVFERFRQVEAYSSRTHGGTGLGLSIVKAFALLHRGRVWASASALGGALFTLALPLAAPASATVRDGLARTLGEDELSLDAVGTLGEERARGQGARRQGREGGALILVIEDNADMNDFIARCLEGSYRVAQAYEGSQGLALALSSRPEAIITDVMMPGMSGQDLIRELRAHRDLDGVPIIVLSALADDGLRVRLLKEGAQDYLSKPFSEAELLARVERLLAERRRSVEAVEEAEDRYRLLAENAVDVIWILDLETRRFRYVSPSVERLRGWTAEEVLLQDLSQAFSPASAAHLASALPARLEAFLVGGQDSHTDELEQPRKDGSLVWTETRTRFVPNTKTGRLEVHGISRDVGERRQVQARLKQDLEEREALIKELYHRTRNNMGVISSMLELKAASVKGEEAARALQAIAHKIDAMALAHQMLYDGGRLSEIDLRDYIGELARRLVASSPGGRDRIGLGLDLDSIPCLIDLAVPLGQVVCELVLNTLHHGLDAEGVGRIRMTLLSPAEGILDFRYADDGPGLPPGYDIRTQGGLGLQTILVLVEHQLQGRLEREPGPGLAWHMLLGGTAYRARV